MKKHPNCSAKNWFVYRHSDQFLEKFSPLYGKVVHDLGCGEMPHKSFFLQHANTYIGVDWSDTLHKPKADIVADLNKPLPISDEVADTVVSFSVLGAPHKPQIMLSEAHRIPKGGVHDSSSAMAMVGT